VPAQKISRADNDAHLVDFSGCQRNDMTTINKSSNGFDHYWTTTSQKLGPFLYYISSINYNVFFISD